MGLLASLATLSIVVGCFADVEAVPDSDAAIEDSEDSGAGEASVGIELQDGVTDDDAVRHGEWDALEEAPPATQSTPCPGGCVTPPPCHLSPGVCVDDGVGNWGCWYPEAWIGSICDNGNPCVRSECQGGTNCVPYQNLSAGTVCDDGDPYTFADSCDGAGSCVGLIACSDPCNGPPACHAGPGQCLVDSGGLNTCVYPEVPDGQSCDRSSECVSGQCSGGACLDAGPAPAGTPCDDGDACTGSDQCDAAGTCAGVQDPTIGCSITPHPGDGPTPL